LKSRLNCWNWQEQAESSKESSSIRLARWRAADATPMPTGAVTMLHSSIWQRSNSLKRFNQLAQIAFYI
jgi:hypothetical protein